MYDDSAELFESNSRVLSLLPILANELIQLRPQTHIVHEFLDQRIERFLHSKDQDKTLEFQTLKKELREAEEKEPDIVTKKAIFIDKEKTVLLTYAFGDIYLEALAIATGGGIRIEYFDECGFEKDQIDLQNMARKYITGKLKEEERNAMYARVAVKLRNLPLPQKEASDYLELRRLLSKTGLSINLATKHLERIESANATEEQDKSHDLGPLHYVDIYTWSCTCKEFGKSFSSKPTLTGKDLLRGYKPDSIKKILFNMFLSSDDSLHVDPLHICPHLLAVVIFAYNMSAIEIEVGVVTDFFQLYEACSPVLPKGA